MADSEGAHQHGDQQQVEQHVGSHRPNTVAHRGAQVLARVKTRREHLDQHKRAQAQGVGAQADRSHGDVALGQGAVGKQGDQNRLGQQDQGQGGGQADQQHGAHRPIQGAGVGGAAGGGAVRGQGGHNHRGHGNGEHAQGKFGKAIRVVQPGHAAGGQKRGQHGVEQKVELADGDAKQRRRHQCQHAAHPGVARIPARAGQQIQAV